MSEQEKQAAIAKVKAQGCRRWMTLIIIAPVFLCVALTLIGPMIRDNLARQEANEECASLVNTVEAVSNSTTFDIESFSGEATITADNLAQMVLFEGEVSLGLAIANRDYIQAISHPENDYFVYAAYEPSYATNFYICDMTGEALGAFTGDETARDLVFNSDGSLFAVSDGGYGLIMLFDGLEIERETTINVRGNQEFRQIDSLAFHPTEQLLFFTSEDELFVYELENYSEVFRIPVFETIRQEIGFNSDGTLFFMSSTGEDSLSYIWGVRD